MPIVVDASVAAKWLLRDETSKTADAVLAEVGRKGAVVPSIFPFEIENILLVAERRKRLEPRDVAEGIALLKAIELTVEPAPTRSIGRFLEIARQGKLSSYDAAYLELAERTGEPLYTADTRLAQAARDRAVMAVVVT